MKFNLIMTLAFASGIAGAVFAQAEKKFRPRVFQRFGDYVNVLDGLTQNQKGDIFFSVPNYLNKAYPPIIMKRCAEKGRWSILIQAKLNEKTGRAGPMGIELGPDGNLYYCDNQYFFDKDYQSKIMRIVLNAQGEPQRIEPVVERLKLANAVRFYGNELFFTDSCFDLPGGNHGGVYRVPMKAFEKGSVKLRDKADAVRDPYFLARTDTVKLPLRDDPTGADGLCIDGKGNLYFGTFGDAHFYTLKRHADGSYGERELLYYNPKVWPCCDGICYDPKRNRVIITDSAKNAVRYWDIDAKKLGLIWQNGDHDGADGSLDQPCEPMIWRDRLLVVNFDMTFPGLMNTRNDEVHTISVIDLDK